MYIYIFYQCHMNGIICTLLFYIPDCICAFHNITGISQYFLYLLTTGLGKFIVTYLVHVKGVTLWCPLYFGWLTRICYLGMFYNVCTRPAIFHMFIVLLATKNVSSAGILKWVFLFRNTGILISLAINHAIIDIRCENNLFC